MNNNREFQKKKKKKTVLSISEHNLLKHNLHVTFFSMLTDKAHYLQALRARRNPNPIANTAGMMMAFTAWPSRNRIRVNQNIKRCTKLETPHIIHLRKFLTNLKMDVETEANSGSDLTVQCRDEG